MERQKTQDDQHNTKEKQSWKAHTTWLQDFL